MTENEQMALIKKYFRTTEIPKGLVLPSDPVLIAGILGDYEAANDLLKEAHSASDKWYRAYMLEHRYIAEECRYTGLQKGEILDVCDQPDSKIFDDQIRQAQALVQAEMKLLQAIGLNKAMR